MSRAVFVSACGDPFILMMAHKLFKENFYDEVDKFYINLNNNANVPSDAISEVLARLSQDPKVHIIYHPEGIGNGMPITEMTLIAKEELVMLLEDDGFIFTSGIVDECFKRIESGEVDAVGSERFSCGPEIGEALKKKYNLDYSGYGDVGPNYWPNFFFCKRQDLLDTDMNFASQSFPPESHWKELDHTFKEQNYADTFGWATMQMLHKGVRFGSVPQNHASPYEISDKRAKLLNWIGEPMKWIHGGSLSASWGGYLEEATPDVSIEIAVYEMETRCAFWRICADVVEGFDDFKDKYKKGIDGLVQRAGLSEERIKEKYDLYKGLLKI